MTTQEQRVEFHKLSPLQEIAYRAYRIGWLDALEWVTQTKPELSHQLMFDKIAQASTVWIDEVEPADAPDPVAARNKIIWGAP